MGTRGDTAAWVDDFDGPDGDPPDPAMWRHELGAGGWGCGQLQHYTGSTANAALTGDGHLALTARREPDGRVTSARLTTRRRVTARYGRVEARIKVPADVGGPWPFDHGCYLLLALAVGGDWPGNAAATPVLPTTLLVDRVEVSSADRPGL